MALRSEIINKAFRRIVDGDNDPLWLNEERNDYFHEAMDLVFEAVIDAELPYYRKYDVTLTKGSNNLYLLPSDLFAVEIVEDSNGPIYQVAQNDDIERAKEGFKQVNGYLKLLNIESLPDTLDLKSYIAWPKDMGDWDGNDDTLDPDVGDGTNTDPLQEFVPDAPLNGPRGARVLAKVINKMAREKDESETESTTKGVAEIISNFVDRMGTINRTEPYITRTR